MLDAFLLAKPSEVMFALAAPAVPELFERELTPVVGQDLADQYLADLKRKERQPLFQEIRGCFLPCVHRPPENTTEWRG